MRHIAIANFINRFINKLHLACDLTDIIEQNPAADQLVKDSLDIAGLNANEVLEHIETHQLIDNT